MCAITVLLSLINLGSSIALSAILSLNSVATLVSYSVPIILLVIPKLAREHPRYGPLKLGRWGLPINLFAICFLLWGGLWGAISDYESDYV